MKKAILTLACVLVLSACNSHRMSQFPSHKLVIEQGNELDKKALSQLQPGLTKAQVSSLLGTPVLTDIFHADRWDYIFLVSRNGITLKQANLVVFFQNGELIRVEGDALKYLETEEALGKK